MQEQSAEPRRPHAGERERGAVPLAATRAVGGDPPDQPRGGPPRSTWRRSSRRSSPSWPRPPGWIPAPSISTPRKRMCSPLRAAVGLNPAAVGETRMRLGAGITGQAARNRQVIATANAPEHPDYLYDPHLGEEPYQSHVSVPLLLGPERRLIGVLNCHKRESQLLRPDEEDFLRTVAGELAIAIENAQLYGLAGRRFAPQGARIDHPPADLRDPRLHDRSGGRRWGSSPSKPAIWRAPSGSRSTGHTGESITLLASDGERLQPFDRASVDRALSVVVSGTPTDGEPFGDDGRGLMCPPAPQRPWDPGRDLSPLQARSGAAQRPARAPPRVLQHGGGGDRGAPSCTRRRSAPLEVKSALLQGDAPPRPQ